MKIAGFPFFSLEMTKQGEIAYENQLKALTAGVVQGEHAPTDLLVLSHGWNNDMEEAENLYRTLLTNLAAALGGQPNRRIAVLGLFWPSKKFADDELIPATGEPRLGAASAAVSDLGTGAIHARIEQLKGVFDNEDDEPLDAAKALIDQLEDSPEAQRSFVEQLRKLVPTSSDAEDDGSDRFLNKEGDILLSRLRAPLQMRHPATGGGAARVHDTSSAAADARGAAAGLGSAFSGMKAAAWRLLNYVTYYQMKQRAGVIGRGLNTILSMIRELRPDIRLHLVGHSFGARVVTAGVDGPHLLRPASLILLQGAYSHHGLSTHFDGDQNGVFHAVVAEKKVVGPIAITHTKNDLAVGVAYAIASRLSGDQRSAFGDATDKFGGIGRNGAVKLDPSKVVAEKLGPAGTVYRLQTGMVTNLLSDATITGHGDVTNPAVAGLLASVIR